MDRLVYTALSGLKGQMDAQATIANNIANMNTTRTAEGGPYRRQQLVFTPRQEQVPFRTILLAQGVVNIPSPTGATMPPGQGVRVSRVGPDDRPARRTYEPDHPDADAEGFVGYPDIDPVTGTPVGGAFGSPAQLALYCLGSTADWMRMHECISQNDPSTSLEAAITGGGVGSEYDPSAGLGDPGGAQ